MAPQTTKVKGLKELIRACDAAGKQVKKELRDELRDAGRIVSDEARSRFSAIDARVAASIRPVVRRAGLVSVEQRKGRTTGKRPDFGSLQMRRALLPALEAKSGEVIQRLERILDRLGRGW